MKRWLAILPLVALVGLVVLAVSRLTQSDPDKSSFASPERPAPSIELTTLDGGTYNFASDGRVTVVNFWATWCTPCRVEHPLLVDMKERGVRVIGVLYKDEAEKGATLLEREGNPFETVVLDPIGDGGIAFGIAGVPETFLVDHNGQIIKSLRSPLNYGSASDFLNAFNTAEATATAQVQARPQHAER